MFSCRSLNYKPTSLHICFEPLKTACTLAVITLNDNVNGQCQHEKVSLALAIIIIMINVLRKGWLVEMTPPNTIHLY